MSMEGMDEPKEQQKEYEQYVKGVTPTHNLGLQMLKAFITGFANSVAAPAIEFKADPGCIIGTSLGNRIQKV